MIRRENINVWKVSLAYGLHERRTRYCIGATLGEAVKTLNHFETHETVIDAEMVGASLVQYILDNICKIGECES